MDKLAMIKIAIILGIFIIIGLILYFVLDNQATDARKFKNEYESLNDQENANGQKYPTVSIAQDNPVKYASFEEIMEVLDSKTGIIYFGFPECPWCRNIVPILLETAQENEIDTVYYFNAKSMRDEKELKDGQIVTTKEGTDEYYQLVDKLKDYLSPYEGLNDENLKRLYFPTVVFVMGGKIVGIHEGTVESQTNPYKSLSKDQAQELKEIYTNNINEIYGICDKSC